MKNKTVLILSKFLRRSLARMSSVLGYLVLLKSNRIIRESSSVSSGRNAGSIFGFLSLIGPKPSSLRTPEMLTKYEQTCSRTSNPRKNYLGDFLDWSFSFTLPEFIKRGRNCSTVKTRLRTFCWSVSVLRFLSAFTGFLCETLDLEGVLKPERAAPECGRSQDTCPSDVALGYLWECGGRWGILSI